MKHSRPHPTSMEHHLDRGGKEGMVLYAAVGILALLTALALVVFTATRVDFQIARNHVQAFRALYQADNGVQCAKADFEERLIHGETMLDIAANAYVSPPSGFTFDPITSLEQLADERLFRFTSTGRSGAARATIEVTVRRADALSMGLFGHLEVGMYPNAATYSYDSDLIANPAIGDSTGEAVVGSNENLIIQPNVTIDGVFAMGKDEFGSAGNYPLGRPVEERPRIDPDPLGAIGGSLAADFAVVQSSNDNASCPYISGSRMILNNHDTVTLTAGNYYLTRVEIGNHSSLLVDTASGPVNIFLSGRFYMGPEGDLNTAGAPSDLRIFSNSDQDILIKPKGDANCFIYAPDALVQIYPNGDFFGAAWGKQIDLKPNGTVWIDTSLLRKVKSHRVEIVSWKELRG